MIWEKRGGRGDPGGSLGTEEPAGRRREESERTCYTVGTPCLVYVKKFGFSGLHGLRPHQRAWSLWAQPQLHSPRFSLPSDLSKVVESLNLCICLSYGYRNRNPPN